ncbi:MAG: winged helix-turn-helix domain-containing protein [Candidatus Bathyarchaeota archaeon]|nr:winged helix-turn-helix domain-containing protein [Candidatus Bathyarchaeota archaeon]
MARRRSNVDIIADILRIARKGAKKTRIVYGANLNFKLLNEYLERLEEAGLITNDQEKRGMLKTTDKGRKYLQHYEGFMEFGLL